MAKYKLKLKNREEIAEGTMAFFLEKPADFDFKAGQFARLTLIDPPETDAKGNGRTFTIASAPYEEDLMIATRMRDTAFKRVMRTIPLGTEISFKGPYGALALHDDAARPAVFLTGGIGITPFRSILLQAAKDRLDHRSFLFYCNRRPEEAAFLRELMELESESQNYKFIGSMTGMSNSKESWQGEIGYINREMIATMIDDLLSPVYYVAGPQAMVAAMQKMLNDVGVSDENICVEEFGGY
ncbi:MAG TPA: FAD-dependent oxidoreductase [Blastocatellia bacterium]|nr:FAD-dependent oxidoreductase [Blastocatellia bacterium]